MEFLKTKDIIQFYEGAIISAKTRIVIVSPYLDIKQSLIDKMKAKLVQDVSVLIICGKRALGEDKLERILSLNDNSSNKHIELFYCDNLHAKIILNESFAIISSMNLYEASENNFECGAMFEAENEMYNKINSYVSEIINSSDNYRIDLHRKR